MQLRKPDKLARVTQFLLEASIVVVTAMLALPKAHSQQDVDPTWYDYQAGANNTTQPSTPATNSKAKQQKTASGSPDHAPEKTRAKKRTGNHKSHVTTAPAK